MVPVMTSTDGRCVARIDVQTGGARHLRQPLHRPFDILARDHHQVGHLVDDDHDVGQRIEIQLLFLVDRLSGFLVEAGVHGSAQFLALGSSLRQARIVAVDVAHAELGHFLVALFHLPYRPLQRDNRLFWIGHDRRQQVWNAVIDRQLEHLGIHHDQAALIRPQPIQQAEDHGVDRDRFTGPGRACDQQMRHAREIDDDGVAADVLAETERELCDRFVVVLDRRATRADRPFRDAGSAIRCRWRCGREQPRRGPTARSSSARCRPTTRSPATI